MKGCVFCESIIINSEWSSIGDKFSDVGNAIKNFLTGVEDSIEGTVKRLLTLVADLGILYVYSECTQTVSGYVPEVLDQEVEKIKQKYEPLFKDPVNTIGGIGQSICDTADEKGVAYSSGYIVTEVVTALLADKGLDKLKNVAKTGKTADNVADIAEGVAKGAGNAAEDAGKAVESGLDSVDNIFTAGKKTFDNFDINNAYVKTKHLSTTGGNGQKFIGASKAEAESILKDALSNGKIVSISDNGLTKAGNASYEIVIDAGKIVGTKGENLVKIVISSDGGMLSAYPIK